MQKAMFICDVNSNVEEYPEYGDHNGQVVVVERQLSVEAGDHWEDEGMYLIRAKDGWEGVADVEELRFLYFDDKFGPFSVEWVMSDYIKVQCPGVFCHDEFVEWLHAQAADHIELPEVDDDGDSDNYYEIDIDLTEDGDEGLNVGMPQDIWNWLRQPWSRLHGNPDQVLVCLLSLDPVSADPLYPEVHTKAQNIAQRFVHKPLIREHYGQINQFA